MAKKTIPIQEFAPDMVDYDSPHMEVCENLVPIRGEYTPIFGGQDVGNISHGQNINSGYSHVVSSDLDKQTSRVESTFYDPGQGYYYWRLSDHDLDTTPTLGYTMVNEVTPDDNNYLWYYDDNDTTPTIRAHALKLSELTDPVDGSNHELSVRWRGWEFNGGTTTSHFIANIYHYDGVSTWTRVETGGDLIDESIVTSGDWYTAVATLTEADVDTLVAAELNFYDELYLVFEPTMSVGAGSSPTYEAEANSDSLVEDDWTSTNVDDSILYPEIVYEASPDASYITSPLMSESEELLLRFPLSNDSSIKIGPDYLPTVNLRAKSSIAAGVYVSMDMYKDGELVYEHTGSRWTLNDSWKDLDWVITPDTIYEDWDFWDGVEVEFKIENEATGGSSQTYRADDSGFSAWSKVGSGGDHHTLINDEDDDTYLLSPSGSSNDRFDMDLESATVPSNHANTKLRVKTKKISGSAKLKVILTDGVQEYSKTFSADQIQSSFGWLTWNLGETKSESFDWDTDFEFTVRKEGNGQLAVSEVEFITSSDGVTVDISRMYMEQTVGVGYDVSWAKLTCPAIEVDITGDSQRIYAGNSARIYQIADLDTGVVDNVSSTSLPVSGDYGATDYPKVWDFCSWGGNVIATNFVDPVQYQDLENDIDAVFDNLIAEVDDVAIDYTLGENPSEKTDAPRAKFCAVVQNSLVLANLNFTGHYSYSVCWSHINDPTKFSFPSYTYLSDSQILVQTPGEITGIVGGDYGIIFKRNSIYRMSYVGSPLMYRFDIVARGVGTAYPKSIVVAGDDIYFFGNDGFYVMRGGQVPQPISEGKVSRMFTDNPLEYFLANGTALDSRSYYPHEYDKQYKIDSSLYGAYDRTNSIVYWYYTCQGDDGYWNKTKGVAYNIKSGKWGQIDLRELREYEQSFADHTRFRHVSVPIGILNTRSDVNDRYGGLVMLSKHDLATTQSVWRPISKYTRPASLKTALFSSKAFGAEDGDAISMSRIRPVFYNNDENSDSIRNLSITVEASDDPYFNTTNSSSSSYGVNTDNSGWFDLKPIAGEYFRVSLDIPSWPHYQYENAEFSGPVSGIVALQFDVKYSGEY